MDGSTCKIKQNYLAASLIMKIFIIDGLSLDLGARVGRVISARMSEERYGSKINESYYNDGQFSKIDLGIAGGVSYRINSDFDFSIRFIQGVNTLAGLKESSYDDPTYSVFEKDSRGRHLQFSMGYWF